MSAIPSIVNPQSQSARQSARQTRTNPSRTSKTLGRSTFAYGHGSMGDTPAESSVPHGFYPALTHFTDAIVALPREFRRHNSLLKEVDAKAWALEENLLHLLKDSSESQAVPYPANPAPIVAGVVREDVMPQDSSQPPESQESKNRRLLFDRVRHTLSDLMMTADEKNHVISNANDELGRQVTRLDTVFPYIAGEVSDESRLGSLTHWAYTNRGTTTKTTNERPRREAAAAKELAAQEAESLSRSEARREAVVARKHRRGQADDYEDARASGARKGHVTKARTGGATTDPATGEGTSTAGSSVAAKRRKVERHPAESGAAMERTASGTSNAGRGASKDTPTSDATKKRSRAPNSNTTAARKRNPGGTAAESPALAPSPLVGTFSAPRKANSPGPTSASRPQSSRAPQNATQSNNGRIRPSSSTSTRVANDSTFPGPGSTLGLALSNAGLDVDKGFEGQPAARETPGHAESAMRGGSVMGMDAHGREMENELASRMPGAPMNHTKREESEAKPAESVETGGLPMMQSQSTASQTPKGRASKTSTPVLPSYEPAQPRSRPTRSTNTAPSKRPQKKANGSNVPMAMRAPSIEEESMHEGDDEDEDGEPRYCYCNEVSFGEMVACDNDACPREWFHLSCVGMTKPPGKNVKWYCNECKDSMRRSRSGR